MEWRPRVAGRRSWGCLPEGDGGITLPSLSLVSQEEGEPGKGKDFISLGLKEGHLLFR